VPFELNRGADRSYPAGEDLAAYQFYFVTLRVDGRVYRGRIVADTIDGFVLGILQNDPRLGQTASVRPMGLTPVVCGGSFSVGDPIGMDAEGRAVRTLDIVVREIVAESDGALGTVATINLLGG
jgi:hypothetical protein